MQYDDTQRLAARAAWMEGAGNDDVDTLVTYLKQTAKVKDRKVCLPVSSLDDGSSRELILSPNFSRRMHA